MDPIGQMENQINECLEAIESKRGSLGPTDGPLQIFLDALVEASTTAEKRYVFLLGLRHVPTQIRTLISEHVDKVNFIEGRLSRVIAALEQCGVYLLPGGELENYLDSYTGSPYKVTNNMKQTVFNAERDLLLGGGLSGEQIQVRYAELIDILDKASRSSTVNSEKYLSRTIGDWIHKVQSSFTLGEITDRDSLMRAAAVEWSTYARLMDVQRFSQTPQGFICDIRLKPSVDPNERSITFHNNTVAANFGLEPA